MISLRLLHIFYNNSPPQNGLPVTLPEDVVNMLWDLVEEDPETTIFVDLKSQTVTLPDGQQHSFAIDAFRKICLLEGSTTSAISVLPEAVSRRTRQLLPCCLTGRFCTIKVWLSPALPSASI